MYRLLVAIRAEALPPDTAALTEMVLALDAENEKLRITMQTLKDMIFGRRSERLVVLVAEQFALELGDLETGVTPPEAANARRRARRRAATLARSPSTCPLRAGAGAGHDRVPVLPRRASQDR